MRTLSLTSIALFTMLFVSAGSAGPDKASNEQIRKLLVGKWEDPDRPGNGMEFNKDGRFAVPISAGKIRARPEGTYRILADGSLKMRVRFGNQAARPRTYRVKVTKDTLTLSDGEHEAIRYRRLR